MNVFVFFEDAIGMTNYEKRHLRLRFRGRTGLSMLKIQFDECSHL